MVKIPTGTTKFVGRSSLGLISKLRYLFLILIFGVMLINTVVIIYQNKSLEPGFKYIGGKWLNATGNLGDESRLLIDRSNNDDGFLKNSWNILKGLWGILSSIFVIYLWLKILTLFIKHFIIWDSSKGSVSFVVAIILFILIQMLVSKDIMVPIYDIRDFFISLPYIFKPLINYFEK